MQPINHRLNFVSVHRDPLKLPPSEKVNVKIQGVCFASGIGIENGEELFCTFINNNNSTPEVTGAVQVFGGFHFMLLPRKLARPSIFLPPPPGNQFLLHSLWTKAGSASGKTQSQRSKPHSSELIITCSPRNGLPWLLKVKVRSPEPDSDVARTK